MHLLSLMMGAKAKRCFLVLMLVLDDAFVSLAFHLSGATDTISPEQSLYGNQTMVSKEGHFVLGFFSPDNSCKFYIGIWYKKVPQQTVIWVANRESAISYPTSSQLKLTEDGHLVLLDHLKIPVWTSNSTSPILNSTIAVLLDSGNLVIRDSSNSSAIIWQSFDHPTDTFVPGSWVGMNKITGEYQTLTSWKNSEDPAPGYFSATIDPKGTSEFFVMWNQSEIYWRSGVWNGQYFTATPAFPEWAWELVDFVHYIDNEQRRYATITVHKNSTITRLVVDVSGQIKQGVWLEDAQEWLYFWYEPLSHCDVYSICGAFSVCDPRSLSFCRCPQGFQQGSVRDWELNDWSSGCVRKTSLQCMNNNSVTKEDGFLVMPNIGLPSNSLSIRASNAQFCRSVCLNNCSCNAYAYVNGRGCLVWNEELRNVQQLDDGDSKAETVYLRLSASDLPNQHRTHTASIISGAVISGSIIILCIFVVLLWRWKRSRAIRKAKAFGCSLVPFTYAELQHMTKNFTEKLGGGGFGPVFKGSLPDSRAIAVKKLEGLGQGEKQFRAEVSTLGSIQHVNLVHLYGFCSERTRRLLVYDFMANGSLDYYLSRKTTKVLDWNTRFKIILGIARGLTYLHERCRKCIIHCDMKPENVLLDSEFCPKVSDFGFAKLVGRDFSHVLTTMKGTIGYLAPEWIAGLPITSKADVYSYGMMLFEIISGRRNTEHSGDSKIDFFPILTATKVIEGRLISIVDTSLNGKVDMEELKRVARVACWCIQDYEDHRPSMGQIVQILEGGLEVNVPPIPRSLQHFTEDHDRCLDGRI